VSETPAKPFRRQGSLPEFVRMSSMYTLPAAPPPVASVVAVRPEDLHSAGPDWGAVCEDGAAEDSVAAPDAVGRLVPLSDGVAVDVDVGAGGCAALPPQPLSRRAAAAAVVRTSACLIR
jgi:hypothetical protein